VENQKYRLYIDESGTHKYSNSTDIKERYLCLLGVIISSEHNQNFISPKWEELRNIFTQDADFPPVFHYVDVVSGNNGFGKLSEQNTRETFNQKYLELLKDGEYTICCVVLDKKTHIETYNTSAMHPYHYCLNVLLERYVRFLSSKNASGDVLAEARGKKEDNLLRSEFERFYEHGTSFLEADIVKKRLTSHKLKLKTKEAKIAGLEIADMLATPMKYLTLKKYKKIDALSDNFTKTVLDTVFSKVRKSPFTGSTQGYGIKLI
jgi:hypothetical protein